MTGKKQTLSNIVLFLSTLILISCATNSYRANDFDYSAEDIQKAIENNIPGGVSISTPNQRGFYSKVFTQNIQKKGKISLIMLIQILGDRRPYDLEVSVKKINPHFTAIDEAFANGEDFVGQDSLAKRIVTKINSELVQRRKEKNMFDDFRPF